MIGPTLRAAVHDLQAKLAANRFDSDETVLTQHEHDLLNALGLTSIREVNDLNQNS